MVQMEPNISKHHIYAKKISYVNPDVTPKFIKIEYFFSVNTPLNYIYDLRF